MDRKIVNLVTFSLLHGPPVRARPCIHTTFDNRAFGHVRNTRKDNCIRHARCNTPLPSCEENHSCLLHIFVSLPRSRACARVIHSLLLRRARARIRTATNLLVHANSQANVHSFVHACEYIRTYMHRFIHRYIHRDTHHPYANISFISLAQSLSPLHEKTDNIQFDDTTRHTRAS